MVALLVGASTGVKLRIMKDSAAAPMPVVSGTDAAPVDVPATSTKAPVEDPALTPTKAKEVPAGDDSAATVADNAPPQAPSPPKPK